MVSVYFFSVPCTNTIATVEKKSLYMCLYSLLRHKEYKLHAPNQSVFRVYCSNKTHTHKHTPMQYVSLSLDIQSNGVRFALDFRIRGFRFLYFALRFFPRIRTKAWKIQFFNCCLCFAIISADSYRTLNFVRKSSVLFFSVKLWIQFHSLWMVEHEILCAELLFTICWPMNFVF